MTVPHRFHTFSDRSIISFTTIISNSTRNKRQRKIKSKDNQDSVSDPADVVHEISINAVDPAEKGCLRIAVRSMDEKVDTLATALKQDVRTTRPRALADPERSI